MGLLDRHSIVRKRPAYVSDGRGGTKADWAVNQPVTIRGWQVDAGDTSADIQNRDGSLVVYTIRGPFDADVRGDDRIVLSGEEFEIDGGVLRQPGVTDRTAHCILRLTRWEG
jgi:hypothetical protein